MNSFQGIREKIIVRQFDESGVLKLSNELKVPIPIAKILYGRGYTSFDACKLFFRPSMDDFNDPFLFVDMQKAADRILTAITRNEKIVVHGDYDVDGVTSTALVIRVLRKLGAICDYYLPNRLTEGYGISSAGVHAIHQMEAGLIITVDCGITAQDEINCARELGIDCIITDHHEPKELISGAIAVLNPKVDNRYPYKHLAGVGVALKLCQALVYKAGQHRSIWEQNLDLVALGTAADIVPLTGENRIIAKLGYQQFQNTQNAGLKALLAVQKLTGKELNTNTIVFQISPCINAIGRLGDPHKGVDLLLTDNDENALQFAKDLQDANLKRRTLDSQVAIEATSWVEEHCHPEKDFALVVGKEDWHVGVIGIVASKLVDKFHRPAILLSIGEDGIARGSGRSIPNLHLLDALNECSFYLESFGGHAAAAGLNIKSDKIADFRLAFNNAVQQKLSIDDLRPIVYADLEVELNDLSDKFFRIIKEMEPFGPGNMRPVLYSKNLAHKYSPRIVGTNHLKMSISSGGVVMDAIAWGYGERLPEIKNQGNFKMAFTLDQNEWNGKVNLQMQVKGITL